MNVNECVPQFLIKIYIFDRKLFCLKYFMFLTSWKILKSLQYSIKIDNLFGLFSPYVNPLSIKIFFL